MLRGIGSGGVGEEVEVWRGWSGGEGEERLGGVTISG